MTIASIDFGRLYRDHLTAASYTPKPASSWDARAAGKNRDILHSDYAKHFISRMDLSGAATLLDIGCGPGTICLPLAKRLSRVMGLDYSRGMLDALRQNAARLEQINVETLHLSWKDDWSDVPECDIVVASRSTMVEDMAAALAKIDSKARRRVYMTHLVGGRFIDTAVLDLLGRKLPPLPDYIYVVNILHGMGIHPRLDYIEQDGRLTGTADFRGFSQRVAGVLGELSDDELAKLRDWYETMGPGMEAIGTPMRWAFISWEK